MAAGTGLLILDEYAPGPSDSVISALSPSADGPASPEPSGPSSTATAPPDSSAATLPSTSSSASAADGADSAPDDDAGPSAAEPPVLLRSVEEEATKGTGDLSVVEGESTAAGDGPLKRYLVEVEKGLPGEAEDFAAAVEEVLGDERGWIGDGDLSLQRVDSGPVDFRVTLAAPDTVDEMCHPLQTNGYVSCTMGGRAIINQNRWVSGVEHFEGDLETYRIYVVNHEVGHALGHGHVDCADPGEPAPVMQQQTFGLQGCAANGWVHP